MTHVDDEADGIRKWLEASGHPLEMRIAEAVFKHSGVAELGIEYIDPVTEKVRESDVGASWASVDEPREGELTGHHHLTGVIECKSAEKPWVILNSRFALGFPAPSALTKDECRSCNRVAQGLLYITNRYMPYSGYGIVHQPGKGDDRNLAFGAVRSAVSAALALRKEDSEYWGALEDEGHSAFFYLPIVVTSSKLYLASLSHAGLSVAEISAGVVRARHADRHLPTSVIVVQEGPFDQLAESMRQLILGD